MKMTPRSTDALWPLVLMAGLGWCAGCASARAAEARSQAPPAPAPDRARTASLPREAVDLGGAQGAAATSPGGVPDRPPAGALVVEPGEIALWVDTSQQRLGAYEVEFQFDPEIVRVLAVEPAAGGWPGKPRADARRYASGSLKIAAISDQGGTKPGRVVLCRLRLAPVAEGAATLRVLSVRLADVDGRLIHGAVGADAQDARVRRK